MKADSNGYLESILTTLFTIAKRKKEPNHPSWVHQQMTEKQNVVYEYNAVFFSHQKEILAEATTWLNLESVMLSKISQTKETKYCMILLL